METNRIFHLPQNFEMLYRPEDIQAAVCRIGAEVSVWARQISKEMGADPLAVPVLTGGIFFYSDLIRNVSHSMGIEFARTWAYEATPFQQRPEVAVDIQNIPVRERAVLLVDDICDSGRTLRVLTQTMYDSGAREVKTAVAVKRMLKDDTFEPDWVGFRYPGTEWLVGYGMDDTGKWRNLPSIHIIRQGGRPATTS